VSRGVDSFFQFIFPAQNPLQPISKFGQLGATTNFSPTPKKFFGKSEKMTRRAVSR
jgi:hypothetical protein